MRLMRMHAVLMSALLGGAALAALTLYTLSPTAPPATTPDRAVTEALGGASDAGYARATAPRAFRFPADHGPHPAFRNEWWYFTGNLHAADGRRFGYELAVFRIAIRPRPLDHASPWTTRQVYMAHLALTDVARGRFHAFERFARGAVGLAGAQAAPFRVWLEDWSVQASHDTAAWRLQAAADGVRLELDLAPTKPVILQGEAGLSRKSAASGNASYYYSLPRIRTHGRIIRDGEAIEVKGLSWMDREWSTSALAEDQAGWDWFALHLSDGYDLMFYRLRRTDGRTDPHSRAVIVDPDGQATHFDHEAVELQALDTWRSPRGVTYPSGWRLAIPAAALRLTIEPWLENQALDVSVRYWEGAVEVRGHHAGEPVEGQGYVELAGYGEEPAAQRR